MTKREAIDLLIEKKIEFRKCKNCLHWKTNFNPINTKNLVGDCEEICKAPNNIFTGFSREIENGRMVVNLNKIRSSENFGCNKFIKGS